MLQAPTRVCPCESWLDSTRAKQCLAPITVVGFVADKPAGIHEQALAADGPRQAQRWCVEDVSRQALLGYSRLSTVHVELVLVVL